MATDRSRRTILATAGVAMALPAVLPARATTPGLKLGCLTDPNGPYADLTGLGSVGSIKLAIEDFGKLHPDIPVELVSADFGLKPDTGLSIIRSWLDRDGVDAVLDFPMSALALATIRAMKATPMDDPLFGRSTIREDGQAMHDMLLLKVKTPQDARSELDLCDIGRVLPAAQAARPLNDGGCRMARA